MFSHSVVQGSPITGYASVIRDPDSVSNENEKRFLQKPADEAKPHERSVKPSAVDAVHIRGPKVIAEK